MAEDWSIQELVSAGWTPADLDWERQCEAAVARAAEGDMAGARAAAGEGLKIARDRFQDGDPRLGTALANYAWTLAETGDETSAGALLAEARQQWSSSGPWIAAMSAPRVARSSLFHMRMEQRHRGVYEDRWREEWSKLAEEARSRLQQPGEVKPAAALERWEKSRPAMLNDTRKLMAAAVLLLTR